MRKISVLYVVLIVLINICSLNGNTMKRLRLEPSADSYLINSTVKIICETEYIKDLVLTLTHNGIMVSENCKAYFKANDMSCKKMVEDGKNITINTFTIKKLKWTDFGDWTCTDAGSTKTVKIIVRVPPVIRKLKPKLNQPRNMAQTKSLHSAGSLIGGFYQSFRRGRGSKTNPINLRDGAALNITCSTTCSSPPYLHVWKYGNATQNPIKKTQNKTKMHPCMGKDYEGQKSGESYLYINCTKLKMVGANEVTCMAGKSKQVIYVLCPGGNKPWFLTFGEIIALTLSSVLVILLIALLCLLIRSQSRRISANENGGTHKRLRKSSSSLVPHSIHHQASGIGTMVPALPPPTPGSLSGGVIGVAETGSLIGGGGGVANSDVGMNTGVRV